jgi:4-hydroxy-tetrahydrodipicolinate synthase
MATKGEMFAGLTVALITPFKNGQVDYEALRKLVDWHIDEGTDCLAPCGTTGESPTLDHDEHEKVVALVCEQARGRIKVMAGTGSNMHPETIAKLARLAPIVAVKEATGSMDQASSIAALCDITLLSGDDSLTLPLMSIGGRGVVSVVGNIVPRDMKAMLSAWEAGKRDEAIRWHYKLFSLCRDMLGIATNPIPIKTAMRMLGRDTGELRLPMCPMDPTLDAKLRQTLTSYGLL